MLFSHPPFYLACGPVFTLNSIFIPIPQLLFTTPLVDWAGSVALRPQINATYTLRQKRFAINCRIDVQSDRATDFFYFFL